MDNNVVHFKADDVIIREGEVVPNMYLITSGSVILYLNYQKPNEYVIGICSKDRIFGEEGLLNHSESMYTAVAYNEVTMVKITDQNFNTFVRHYPDKVIGILKNISEINLMLKKDIDILMDEVNNVSDSNKQNEQLKRNILKYAFRGIEAYTRKHIL